VRKVVTMALKVGTFIAVAICVSILAFAEPLVRLFTYEQELIDMTVPAIRISFLATPLILFQLVGSAYFQAIGRARPALFLTMTKQGFCLIPLIYLLPKTVGLDGVWMAFPIADVLSASICFYFLWKQMKVLGKSSAVRQLPVGSSSVGSRQSTP
jgi:Na+-driven multidrug efflux pump